MQLAELLRKVVAIWEQQRTLCEDAKERDFGKSADRIWGFLGKSYRQLYIDTDDQELRFPDAEKLYYKPRINKTAEAVGLLVPAVLSRVPHRLVSPRRPPLPEEIAALIPQAAKARERIDAEDQLRAWFLQWWLNYTPTEFGLYGEARRAVVEGIAKGRGVLWHEIADGPSGPIPASYFESVNNLFIDADAKQSRDAAFIIRKRRMSVWKVSEIFGIRREKLRAQARSNQQEAHNIASGQGAGETPGKDNDICEYYEVWSRIGIGHWLDREDDSFKGLVAALDELGAHVWLAIMPGIEAPLNLQPDAMAAGLTNDELTARLEWPIAFWAESAGNPWPCSFLDLRPNCENSWATSILEAGLPMQIFLDHLYSFVMNRLRLSCKSLVIVSKAIEKAVKDAIATGFDLELVPYTGKPGDDLDSLVKLFEFPELNKDVWEVLSIIENAYDRATGLLPLLYGAQGKPGMRSAAEAGIRESHVSTRPDDYADTVEAWMSAVAAKEGQATRLHVGESVAPLFGEQLPNEQDPNAPQVYGPLTAAWLRLVFTPDDPALAASEMSYTVEAGSGKRKNKQKQVQDMQQLMQVLTDPAMQVYAATGDPQQLNALVDIVGDALEVSVDRLKFPQMQPAPPEGEGKEK